MTSASLEMRTTAESRGLRLLVLHLALGVRLAVRGGRGGSARLLMGAAGLGLCVMVLLAGTSVTTAMAARQVRADTLRPITAADLATGSTQAPPTGLGFFEVHEKDLVVGADMVTGGYVAVLTGSPARPPGLSRWPANGELFLSPALRDLIATPAGASLRAQIPGEVVGTISADGLTSSRDLRFYAGIAPSIDGPIGTAAQNGDVGWGWGTGGARYRQENEAIGPLLQALITAGAALVLVPLALFVTILSRLGAAASARRLAAIRLIGASVGQIRLMAVGESLVSAVLGVALGSAGFLLARQAVGWLSIGGDGFFPSDFHPKALVFVLVVLAVPAVAVGAAVAGSARAVRHPLGIVPSESAARLRFTRQRLVWWTVVVFVSGAAAVALASLLGPTIAVLGVSVMAVLLAVPLVAPLLLRALLRGLGGRGSMAWQLGVRRLQFETALPARVMAGLSVVVAGAIALQSLVAGLSGQLAGTSHSANHEGSFRVQVSAPTVTELTTIPDRIRSLGGYSDIRGGTYVWLTGSGAENGMESYVGTCEQIRENLGIAHCTDGDAFAVGDGLVSAAGSTGSEAGLRPGTQLKVAQSADESATMTLPASFRNAVVDANLMRASDFAPSLVLTPAALGADGDELLRSGFTYLLIRPTADDASSLTALRTGFADLSWRAEVSAYSEVLPSSGRFQLASTVRWGLIAAGLLTLLVSAAGMVLVSVQQLLDRRRALTLLVASGVPRSVIRRAVMIGALIPAVVGVALATAIGAALAAGLQFMLVGSVHLDVRTVVLYGASGLLALLAVTACTIPAVGRLTRVESLRTS